MTTLIAFLLALGILVTFHELGHYLVARACGVRVVRFSVGFGKPIFTYQKTPNDTEWTLAWIPLGGYVRMVDERDEESLRVSGVNESNVFNRKPVWQRILVVVAGPVMNLLLACLFYGGLQTLDRTEPIALIGEPARGSLAEKFRLEAGDKIVAANGEVTEKWSDVNWESLRAMLYGNDFTLEIDRAGEKIKIVIDADSENWPAFTPAAAGAFGLSPLEKNVSIRRVVPGSAGERAGLMADDRLTTLNGQNVRSSSAFTQIIRENPDTELALVIEREGQTLSLLIRPEATEDLSQKPSRTIGKLGVGLGGDYEMATFSNDTYSAMVAGVKQTYDMSVFSLVAFYKMLQGEMSWRMLGGPVTIADAAGQSAKIGLAAYIGFLAMLSVSLGVLNLLPIPVLDGGHLMYYLVELIRGKPLSDRWMELGQKVGMAALGLLTALALFNDISRFF
ncbi:MAG: RIP metalloprotease RseP [Burkholderiales bacterium]|nr:RIP metalloprotease RseP [Burkholderiales bacterium]